MTRYITLILAAAIALTTCTGCAFLNRQNTPTANFVEQKLLPKTNPAKVLSYPALLPVGVGALAVDAVVIHPVSVLDDAYRDTERALWRHFDWEDSYVTECAKLVPRTALSPVVFTFMWTARSVFDIPPHVRRPKKTGAPQKDAERSGG